MKPSTKNQKPTTMNTDTVAPSGKITFAIFHLLTVLQDSEPHITDKITRTDIAHICRQASQSLSHAADRLQTTPAKAQVLRQLQNEIQTAQLN